ncbi:major facilitator superfamily domain-containing protein [Aspergillus granulosus]|uniref:Major facilitator superfamily domain-containing protein n=1 Tax=Aspergillus granulosus TaxID=176169 RepID=A0ABR4HMG3_9EURO
MDKLQFRHVEAAEPEKALEVPYLLSRHGTLDLDPLPSMSDVDPYNWPAWKKTINLAPVAFHAMMATFTAASIQCAPFADRYDRRHILLFSLPTSLVGNISCAKSPSYATMGLYRAITGFFICPAAAIGSGVVREVFFKRDCARYMGVWTLMVMLGVPSAPFIPGFVVMRVGYRWIYWILAIVNAVQLILYFFFFGAETLYTTAGREVSKTTKSSYRRLLTFKRLGPLPLTPGEFLRPLRLAARPCFILPSIAYAIVFLFANILIAIEIPQIFPEKFSLNAEQVGLQNLAIIFSSGVGELFGGLLSNQWMWYREKKMKKRGNGMAPAPEYRLWLSYAGIVLVICGVVVFLVQTENTSTWWNVNATHRGGRRI